MPGFTRKMDPVPDHGEQSYQGSGRLAGKKTIITGAIAASAARWPSRSRARAPTC
jgi:hypothetical protein